MQSSNYHRRARLVSETVVHKAQKQGGFLNILFSTLNLGLPRNFTSGKGTVKTGEGIKRAGEEFWCHPSLHKIIKSILKKEHYLMVSLVEENSTRNKEWVIYVTNFDKYLKIGTS